MTAAEINRLPARVRQYIHDLETRCDPNGETRQLWILREQNIALQKKIKELKCELGDPQ